MFGRILGALKDPHKVINFLRTRFQTLAEYSYTLIDSKFHVSRDSPVLFVDCGSNIGQGFRWFSSFYDGPNIEFHLFEPNPNCIPYLELVEEESDRKVTLRKCAVGTVDGTSKFYGLGDEEGGKISQGGSTNPSHNSHWYQASEDAAAEVDTIDFSSYLSEQSRNFDQIVVKMDIEGAEVELLEHLLSEETIDLVSVLYVEFHSQYQSQPQASQVRQREDAIVSALKSRPIRLRIWH